MLANDPAKHAVQFTRSTHISFIYRFYPLLNDTPHFECEICSSVFLTRKEVEAHHTRRQNSLYICCNCDDTFESLTSLSDHHQVHKTYKQIEIEAVLTDLNFEEYTEEVQAVLDISSNDSRTEYLYILDDSQCVNEVVIEDTENIQRSIQTRQENSSELNSSYDNTLPRVTREQSSSRKISKKSRNSENADDDDSSLSVVAQPSTSIDKTFKSTKVRHQKRRHDSPNFFTPSYIMLNPNEEVDVAHIKCLRCEQLFISKFVFFRHIEKGKCFVNSCDVCPAYFTKNSDFYSHYVIEHTDRAICNFCFRTFMYEKNVKEHMLRHLDQFRHRCEECHKGFYTVREYRNHYKNRHMGIRHSCSECGRSFADEYYFKRHIATHNKRADDDIQ